MPSTTAKTFIKHRGTFDPFGSTPEQVLQNKEMAAKLNEEARDNWDRPEWHRQVAQDIADSLDYGFTFNNVVPSYLRVETVGEFDRPMIRERRGLKVFYTARGGWIDETQLREDVWEVPRDTLGFHVSEMEDKLRANFADSIASIVNLAEQRLDAEVNRRIFTTMQAAVPFGSPSYVSVANLGATNGTGKAVVDAALRAVKDAIRPNGEGPAPVTIIGRAAMIDQLLDFDFGFAPETNEQIRQTGRLGTYRGANLVTLINYADEDGASYVPANELWIFGGDVGRFYFYGPLLVKTWTENNVDYVHYRARKDIGGIVTHPEMARRIVDSNVTP